MRRLANCRETGMATKTEDKPSRWSQRMTQKSNALDLEPNVFRAAIQDRNSADSSGGRSVLRVFLRNSADQSTRRKGTPFQSAMPMLNFYVNRAGRTLAPNRKHMLANAKTELRRLYGN
jgi:hypothetical protein